MISQSSLTQIKEAVITKLNTDLGAIRIIDGFCREQFFGAAETTMLSVKIGGVKTSASAFEDFLGGGMVGESWQDCHGELADIELNFTLFLPINEVNISQNTIFEQVCYSLRKLTCAEFYQFSASELEFLEKTQCFIARFKAKCTCLLVENKPSVMLKEIVVNATF